MYHLSYLDIHMKFIGHICYAVILIIDNDLYLFILNTFKKE